MTMLARQRTGELIDASTLFESGSLANVFTGTLSRPRGSSRGSESG
jgi:hypothetical protein